MANRYPLIVDSTDGNKLKEIPSGDNLQLTGNSIIGVTDVTASGTIAASILSAASIMKGGTEISSVAVSGSYTDLSSRPTLLSDFTNDLNLLEVGGNIGQLVNNVGYITASDLTNMTIDVNNTGDLIGSVFSDDSTVMIDSILSAVNLDGTIRGHVSPNANQHNLWDIGLNTIRFKNAYFQGTVNATAFVGAVDTASLTVSSTNVALGSNAGTDVGGLAQGAGSIAIGSNAGNSSQNIESVAIGFNAGKTSQGEQSVAIGAYTAITSQGNSAVAIGDRAGATSQGQSAIAIGSVAGYANQAARSIVISASGVAVNNTREDSLVITPIRNAGGTHALEYDPTTGEVTYDTLGGGGSGLQSRSTATGTTSSLADASQADLDITGFKSYTLMAITTDKAARVRLYVNTATRTADAARAEGVDPTSDAGVIAEVITTGAETVIISPGAYGFNLESSPTTNIPCRVTNKSGSTGTVQVDVNILQLEA